MSDTPHSSEGDVRLRSVIPLIVANFVIGAFFLLLLAPLVLGLYERGYGRFSAVTEFIVLPSIGLVLSVGVPVWLCRLGARRFARNTAICFLLFMWLPYFGFVAEVAAI
jgi:hypothetical protein